MISVAESWKNLNNSGSNENHKTTSNSKIFSKKHSKSKYPITALRIENCLADSPRVSNLLRSNLLQLQKLSEYEIVCGGPFAKSVMIFIPTPYDSSSAQDQATDIAVALKQLSQYSLRPLVIMEPETDKGIVNFKQYQQGAYDAPLNEFYSEIKKQGISSSAMGLWVHFPEANIPVWNNTNPVDFAACVTRSAKLQKTYFPDSQAGILLDSKSYPNSDSWQGGAYASLMPYIKRIPSGLIDSFGLQGYPWPPEAGESAVQTYNASNFANANLAIESARFLKIKSVWLSTGSFSQGYSRDTRKLFSMSPLQRQQSLDSIVSQAKKIKSAGFNTAVNIFAQNKLNMAEGMDWSYWRE